MGERILAHLASAERTDSDPLTTNVACLLQQAMKLFGPNPRSLVSPKIYRLISESPKLSGVLVPEGAAKSPYEVLDYQSTLVLHDPEGLQATAVRRQRVRFLQNGVSALLDHFWGDGAAATNYEHTGGPVVDTFSDQGVEHVVIQLKRAMARGEELEFGVARTIVGGFQKDEEWLETVVDHPVDRVMRTIVFPGDRPPHNAVLKHEEDEVNLPLIKLSNSKTIVTFDAPTRGQEAAFTILWRW